MTCKGVYASLGFSIYITKDELRDLLRDKTVDGKGYIGKQEIGGGRLRVFITPETREVLKRAYNQDHEAIETAKASMASGYFKSVNKIRKP